MSLRGHLLAAVFAAGVAGVFAAPACAETLADALALAYDTNPNLQAQRAAQRVLDENYVQARSGWRPTLTLQAVGSYNELRTPSSAAQSIDLNGDGIPDAKSAFGVTRSNAGSLGATLNQPIWTGGRTAAAVSAAEADILSGRETLRRVESQVMLTVVQAYVDVQRDQEAVRIRQENVGVLQRQLEESKARFDVGEITRTDVAQSESRLAAAQSLLQSAVAQLAVSRANYAAIVGRNPGELAPAPSLAFLLPSTADDAFSIAEKFNPALRAQEYAEQASRARVAGARAERMPSLSLQASGRFIGGAVDPLVSDVYSRETQASAVFTMPLFTGGVTTSRIRQAVERNNTDRINIETQRRSVLQNITQAWNQLIAARANIDSTSESVRAADIAAQGTREEQKVGLRTTLDVLNAEQELRNDELSAVAAKHDEYLAAATVISQMGRLEARDIIPAVHRYDPKTNFHKVRMSWGWVPWEEPIGAVDHFATFPAIPSLNHLPDEPAIGPGLQPPPATAPATAATPPAPAAKR